MGCTFKCCHHCAIFVNQTGRKFLFSVAFCSSHAHPRVRAEKKMSVREQDYQVGFNIICKVVKVLGVYVYMY